MLVTVQKVSTKWMNTWLIYKRVMHASPIEISLRSSHVAGVVVSTISVLRSFMLFYAQNRSRMSSGEQSMFNAFGLQIICITWTILAGE